jgi:RNA polymerase sigma-70 factor (ECF subfamily)
MSRSPDPNGAQAEGGRADIASPPLSFDAEILALLPQLRRYSRSLTRSDAESEDLLQDCVEKALSHRAQWRGANIRAWAYRIMTNLHLNTRRALARRPSVGIEEAETVAESVLPSDPLARNRLVRALDTLPEEARAVLMLVAVEGHSYQEIADMLDIPIGTVMSRLSRARQMLREKLAAENVIHLRSPR